MSNSTKHKLSCKIWLEYHGKPLIGKGGAEILEQIGREQSISKAAKKLGMSYRYVWSYLQKIEKALGEPVIETFRGGKAGGGGARLTTLGKSLLEEYRRVDGYLGEFLSKMKLLETVPLKMGENYLKGRVKAVEKGTATAKVAIEVEAPPIVKVHIPRETFEKLNLKVGDYVEVLLKTTEVKRAD